MSPLFASGLAGAVIRRGEIAPRADWQRKALSPLIRAGGSSIRAASRRKRRDGASNFTEMRSPAARSKTWRTDRRSLVSPLFASRAGRAPSSGVARFTSSDWQRKGALAPLFEQAVPAIGRASRRKRATG